MMTLDRAAFREALLGVMEVKVDPDWHAFTTGQVPADRLHLHLEHEYAVYVRDFPVLVGRAYVQCPVAAVRQDLAENLYEEETGGIAAGRPHPELFLEIPRALAMDLDRFGDPPLLPEARAYRAVLDDLTVARGWELAAAATTLWLEGTPWDRSVLDPSAPPRPEPPLDRHPLVVHYGLPVEALALTRVHRDVEGDHRAAAWRAILDHVAPERRQDVVDGMHAARAAWWAYRKAVAIACGVGD